MPRQSGGAHLPEEGWRGAVTAAAEAQALSREMKEKLVKKNNEFRAAQARAGSIGLRIAYGC